MPLSVLPGSCAVRRLRAVVGAIALTCAWVAPDTPLLGQESTAFYRLFLKDGTTVTSYGDFARVGDRVVFSLPLGEVQGQPRLHLASLPVSSVDWPTTERYRNATRAAQYASTRGEEDFAVLSAEVARLLNDIAQLEDPRRRLAIASDARAKLAAWPATHFGYKATEIRQILALVDEVIADLRAAAGEGRFDISLVAGVVEAPDVTPLPKPSLQESIVQSLWAAQFAASAAERRALLEAAVGALDTEGNSLPTSWVVATRGRAERALAAETALDARVTAVRTTALASMEKAAARGDVKGVESVLRAVRRDTTEIAASRGDEIKALLDTIEARLDATRRLRLALDQWELKGDALRSYQRAVDKPLRDVFKGQSALEDIKLLAGPSLGTLASLDKRFAGAASRLAGISVPPDGKAVHALMTSALQMAAHAVRLRRTAIGSGNMQEARDASAAAAGALMMLDRVRQDVARLATPPQLP